MSKKPVSSATSQVVGKHPKQAKPAKPAPAKVMWPNQGGLGSHVVTGARPGTGGGSKHAAASKKHQGGKKHQVRRGWSPDEAVALCSARAVAEHLRIATGTRVSDDDVLVLHHAAGGSDDAGATIQATLAAAWRTGLGGHRVSAFWPVIASAHPVILGGWLPGGESHAVVHDRGACWSWGEPFDPADYVVEEVWAVRWL